MQQVSILIGNTDNKLAQNEWAEFVARTKAHIESLCERVHFFGGPPNYEPAQNACWVVDMREEKQAALEQGLREIRQSFRQDSVALLVSRTQFL